MVLVKDITQLFISEQIYIHELLTFTTIQIPEKRETLSTDQYIFVCIQ